jgi:hypothetical protein
VNLPKAVVLDYDFAKYERTYQAEGNDIVGKEVLMYKASHTPPEQYQKVRKFCDDMTSLTNEMIMIKKKG